MIHTSKSLIVTALMLGWVTAPASANLLNNGGFDDYGPQGTTGPIDDWTGGSGKYNGTTHILFGGPGYAYGGDNYGTVDAFLFGLQTTGTSIVASQSVAAAAGPVSLTGAIAGGTTLSLNDPHSTDHFVSIEDGGSLSETYVLSANLDGGTNWEPFALNGVTDGSGVTVTWGYVFTQDVDFFGEPFGPNAGILTTHVDELVLVPEPTTLTLAVLGGLALIRRRTRRG